MSWHTQNVFIFAGLSGSDHGFNVVSFTVIVRMPDVEYSHKWPVLQKSKISGNHVYCQTCRADINIGHSE